MQQFFEDNPKSFTGQSQIINVASGDPMKIQLGIFFEYTHNGELTCSNTGDRVGGSAFQMHTGSGRCTQGSCEQSASAFQALCCLQQCHSRLQRLLSCYNGSALHVWPLPASLDPQLTMCPQGSAHANLRTSLNSSSTCLKHSQV